MRALVFKFHLLSASVCLVLAGCRGAASDNSAEAPPAVVVQPDVNPSLVQVKNPGDFRLATVGAYQEAAKLNVTGSIAADVSRTVPVISIASGRVVAIHARMGDYVHKGQLLFEVQSNDIASAFGTYVKAVSDERLAKVQLQRAQLLADKGAIPTSQLEIAQNAEEDAQVAVTAAEEQLRVLGVDKNHPTATVKVTAPVSGYVIQQNITDAAAAGVTYGGSATAFTIADLSRVWVLCDVYENDLPKVRLGQVAEIRLTAYPDKVFQGRIGDIGAVLDPSLHTAKVRVEVANPAMLMRVGMFATATFYSLSDHTFASVPATAVLHLHDRDWVFVPEGEAGRFRRVGVQAGDMLSGGLEELRSGLAPGQQVVVDALTLQNTVDQ